MTILIDAAPLNSDEFSFEFINWLAVTIDILNENLLNPTVPQLTSAQIVSISGEAPDGALWYSTDHVPPVYVGKINGALVQFTTTPFP